MVIRHILKVYHGILGILVDIRPILGVGLDILNRRVLSESGKQGNNPVRACAASCWILGRNIHRGPEKSLSSMIRTVPSGV